MRAEILTIGSELLVGHVVDTNSAYLSEELNALGIGIYYHTTIGDNPDRIKAAIKQACMRSDLLICTGGLGPTTDDLTHETIAEAFGLELEFSEQIQQEIIEKFNAKSIKEVPPNNFKQASYPASSLIIPNRIGTAIGIDLTITQKLKESLELELTNIQDDPEQSSIIMTFPGVPVEMKSMWQSYAKPRLKKHLQNVYPESGVIKSRKIKFFGIGESSMAERIGADVFASSNPSVAPYAVMGECYVRVTAQAESELKADEMIAITASHIESKMQEYIYGYDNDEVLTLLTDKLKTKNLKISVAESCTGGLLSKYLTDVPGASAYIDLNLITYSNKAKQKLLNVPAEILTEYGAVSEETAAAMVEGLSLLSPDADICISVTGIAGPDGGTDAKPVGTIYVGIKLANQLEHKIIVDLLNWSARRLNREQVRELAVKKILYKVFNLI